MPFGTEIAAQGLGVLLGAAQGIIGAGQIKRGNEKLDRLFSQRKAYSTPAEIFDILNLTQSNAAQGFSDDTMNYFTGQAGSGLASSLGVAKQLGADPNELSAALDKYYGDIFRIGAESDLVKMKKFDSFTNALNMVAENRTAEWQSQENILKDRLQRETANVEAGRMNVQSGINLALTGAAGLAGSDPYGLRKKKKAATDESNRNEILSWSDPATVPAAAKLDLSIGTLPSVDLSRNRILF